MYRELSVGESGYEKMVFFTQTDTTTGFISKSKDALDKAKKRVPNKTYITALPSLKALKKRVPKKFKNLVRRSKKTTFILNKNFSFRVIKDKNHKLLINRLGWAYTSSANESNKEFDFDYAYKNADVIVYPLNKIGKASKIYKLGKKRVKRVR